MGVASHAVLMLFLLTKWSGLVVFENAATFQPLESFLSSSLSCIFFLQKKFLFGERRHWMTGDWSCAFLLTNVFLFWREDSHPEGQSGEGVSCAF
jgi:hypothetical protein